MLFGFSAGEVFQTAVEIETNGLSFYAMARRSVSDPGLAELFASLERDEMEHKKHFEAFLAALPEEQKRPTVSDPDNEIDQYIRALAGQHIFGPGANPVIQSENLGTVEDVLKLALQFEKDSVIFYLNVQEVTSEGEARELVDLLVKEELQHVRKLSVKLKQCSSDLKACLVSWHPA